MDHGEYRNRIGQLEKEVKKLNDDNDHLRKTNFKNAEVSVKKESVLKSLVESLRNEIDALKSTHLIENLEKENEELKSRVEDLESDKRALEMTVDYNDKENEEAIKHYQTEYEILQDKVIKLQTCDDCALKFEDKTEFKNHILVGHYVENLKCNNCRKGFQEKVRMKEHNMSSHLLQTTTQIKCNECAHESREEDALKTHISIEHARKSNMLEILRKEKEVLERLSQQKINLYDSLYKLKQKEIKQVQKCFCKGGFCRIAHFRYRWINSQSDTFFNKLKLMNSNSLNEKKRNIKCENCDLEFNNEDDLKKHIESHESDSKLQCHECDQIFNSDECLKSHYEINHKPSPFESTFFNPSLNRSKFLCQPCEKAFPDEDYLLSHMELEHNV